MPPARPGSLGDDTYADVLAYILRENGARAGTRPLPTSSAALKALAPPSWPRGGGGGLAPGATIPPAPTRTNPLQKITPVTEAMLTRVPDGEWLTWRRTYDAYGFSPLKQINKTNVGDLRLAWSWSLPAGQNATTPIVHDGVMFVLGFGDRVQALDAATGDLLWQYSRRLPQGVPPSHKRSLSIYGTRLYVPTSDVHVVALDVKTGRVVWDQAVGDPKTGLRLTGGTLVARNKVMVGTTGRSRRRQLHRRARRRDRQGSLALLRDRAAGCAGRQLAGTRCRSTSGTAARCGFPAATIRYATSPSSRPATPTTPDRSAISSRPTASPTTRSTSTRRSR